MSNLQILSNSIRTFENLYSLTDLHKASGGDEKHKPILFLRLDQTKDLISEIENDKVQICTLAVKTVRGGKNPSTYACMEIALAYAAWIDPKFHLIVLRAYMAMKGNSQKTEQIAPLAELPSPYINEHEQRQVQEAVNRAVHRTKRDYNNVYHHLKTKFNVAKYTQLKPEQMRDVLIYLASLPIKSIPSEFETVGLPAPSTVRINDVLPMAIFYRDVGKMIKELGAICEELSKSRKSELVAILKNYCDNFGERAALVRKVRGVLLTQLGQLPQDDQDYLRDFIEL